MGKVVIIETPYSADEEDVLRRNLLYARACVRDSLMRGEKPFASHLFFTQPGILDDNVEEERHRGIRAGRDLVSAIPDVISAVYEDLGISKGMKEGIENAKIYGRDVEFRSLGETWEEDALKTAREHSHANIWGLNALSKY